MRIGLPLDPKFETPGAVLAGNIVQVRLERKALSAAVSPTCCSGREQRSKPAHAGGAIPFGPRSSG